MHPALARTVRCVSYILSKEAMRPSLGALVFGLGLASAQTLPIHPVPRFPLMNGPLHITRAAELMKPFTTAGESGAFLGQQDGSFEAWVFPVKVLSAFCITAELADYPVPIDLNPLAAAIEVRPECTTISYSHAAFTVKQHMFVPRGGETVASPIVLFEIASVRPMRLTFRFQPDLLRMWPAPNFGRPSAEWVGEGVASYYLLHTDSPALSGAVALPRSTPGILSPYQERPKTFPLELKIAFDPGKDSDLFFPLLIAAGAGTSSLERQLADENAHIAELYAQTANYWAHFFDKRLIVESPDPAFDNAMRWAAVAIDQARVKFHQETGMVAGYYSSGDSARPGFGWFFGRDTLWTLYAVHSYGDFSLSRTALEFLIRRQRADGKIMHEFSQTADLVDWQATPYFYAAADATPLFVTAMDDYVNASGDVSFLRHHWEAVKRAYGFTRAHDSDGDGIYENTEGTGWVESWPPGMPHQEIYLAALDQQSCASMAHLAALMQDDTLAQAARSQSEKIRAKLAPEYFDESKQFYSFSRNADGTTDKTATIYPSVAWWTGELSLPRAETMLNRWASAEFSTDWGTRDVSDSESIYDPISYHQGSVWPLFTGWVSLAEYRASRPLSGYAHLMQNVDLTYAQDLGAVTELLSGALFQPLERSTSHQTWSSAMALTPAIRGLFGLDWDALHHTLRLAPHLPVTWDSARLRHVSLGTSQFDLEFKREGEQLMVEAKSPKPERLCLVPQSAPREDCAAAPGTVHEMRTALPPVEVGIRHGLPEVGAQTQQLKVMDEQYAANRLVITVEAPAGSTHDLPLRINRAGLRISGAETDGHNVRIVFPSGTGRKREVITLSW